MLHIQLIGSTTVSRGGDVPGRSTVTVRGVKTRQLLALLALAQGRTVSKDELADRLWDGQPPRAFVQTLESYVSVLRRDLGLSGRRGAVLATAAGGYRLEADGVEVDVVRCHRLLRGALAMTGRGAVALVMEALALDLGDLLADEPYAAWAESARRTHDALRGQACLHAAEHALAEDDVPAAVTLAQRVLDADPLAEAAVQVLLRAHLLAGRSNEALRVYGGFRDRVAEELGSDPDPATQALYHQALRATRSVEPMPRPGDVRSLIRVLRDKLRVGTSALPEVYDELHELLDALDMAAA